MKKKLLIALMTMSVTLCGAFGFSGCDISEFLENAFNNKNTENEDDQTDVIEWGMPVENVNVTCRYEFAFDKTLDRYAVHQGMDFEAPAGTDVLAVKKGTITKVVKDHILNENYVTVTHDEGITSTYKYIVASDGLEEGNTVERGDVIGTVAEAGGFEMNDGEHLHFEMRVNGKTVDPNLYLKIFETDDEDTQHPDDGSYDDDTGKDDKTQYPDSGKEDEPGTPDQPAGDTDVKFCLPVEDAYISCGYEFTYDKTLDRYAVHQGMDFQAPAGTEVLAAADGTVTKVVTDHILNENYVTITHGNGITTTYKYIVAKEDLKEGDSVKCGDIIGTIAPAGGFEMNDGEHLHFEMRVNGKTTNPAAYLEIADK